MKVKVLILSIIIIIGLVVLEVTTNTFSKLIKGIPSDWNKDLGIIITDEGDKVPLPQGFKDAKVTNKIDEGIVIEDGDGNQFVWVSTKDIEFKRDTLGIDNTPLGYRIMLVDEKDKDKKWDVIKNPKLETDRGGVWQPEEAIYDELLKSVEKYSGFYMGRYEATYRSGDNIKNYIPSEIKSTIAVEENSKNEPGKLWNFVSANDAFDIAKNMYKENSTVVSHLPYGEEWDVTMNWLILTKDKTREEITENSSSWGNTAKDTFSNTISFINTGSFEETKANNIYDMAGNLFEWSREYFGKEGKAIIRSNHLRAYKGELYNATSAGSRTWVEGRNDQKFNSVGFRVALYIK